MADTSESENADKATGLENYDDFYDHFDVGSGRDCLNILQTTLLTFGVDTSTWRGIGEPKTVVALYQELKKRKSTLSNKVRDV